VLTVIACVVWPPGDHTLPVALLDVNVTLPPMQNEVGPDADIVGAGLGFTVTTFDAVLVHPFASVTVTV